MNEEFVLYIWLSSPALPPYKDTKNNPHFLAMWITIYFAVWIIFRIFVRLVAPQTHLLYNLYYVK